MYMGITVVSMSGCNTDQFVKAYLCILLLIPPTSTLDPQETLVMDLLCHLLADGQASPFYQALIESGVGSNYSPGAG